MYSVVSGVDLARWRQQAKKKAIAAQISPTEVDWLLQEIANLDNLSLHLGLFQQQQLSLKKSLEELTRLWELRLQEHLPVQYLAGSTPWRNFSLVVSPDVLIPRPETEYIIDLALKASHNSLNQQVGLGNWVDLGTGSGAIAIGLADVLTKASVYAVDTSALALAIARGNAANCGFSNRIKFRQGSWWSPLSELQGKVSGMVSNPPYIPTATLKQLQPEVVKHEPHLALDGGNDGLDYIRHLVNTAPNYLVSGGVWLIEMMAGQAKAVRELLEASKSYTDIEIYPDFAGIERFARAYRK